MSRPSSSSSEIEINVNHIRECLLRNGFVSHVAHQSGNIFHEQDELLAPAKVTGSPLSTSDELKHLLVVNVIRNNTHIVEQLLVRQFFFLPKMYVITNIDDLNSLVFPGSRRMETEQRLGCFLYLVGLTKSSKLCYLYSRLPQKSHHLTLNLLTALSQTCLNCWKSRSIGWTKKMFSPKP